MPISAQVKAAVVRRARHRCEYCSIVGWELQIDHISPRSPRQDAADRPAINDLDGFDNLAAACAHCNRFKAAFTSGQDPLSGRESRFFHPRLDVWAEHFSWSYDFLRLLQRTPIGGATIARLRMNDGVLRSQRQLLRQAIADGANIWP